MKTVSIIWAWFYAFIAGLNFAVWQDSMPAGLFVFAGLACFIYVIEGSQIR